MNALLVLCCVLNKLWTLYNCTRNMYVSADYAEKKMKCYCFTDKIMSQYIELLFLAVD